MEDIFVYMDDIFVFSRDTKAHLQTIEEIFRRLKANGLAISLKKCRFGEQSIEFVGYKVSREGITPLPRKLQAISSFPVGRVLFLKILGWGVRVDRYCQNDPFRLGFKSLC